MKKNVIISLADSKYYELLKKAEDLSDDEYKVIIKWSKIKDQGIRKYQRCFGAPFMIQISGSGLVAPCGMLFNEKYKKFHILKSKIRECLVLIVVQCYQYLNLDKQSLGSP